MKVVSLWPRILWGQVLANTGEWVNGVVVSLWNEGNPYRIVLDDESEVWAPDDTDEFIRTRNT